MHFNDRGQLIVSAPYYVASRDIKAFVDFNMDWIAKQQQNYKKHSFDTGDSLFLFGQKYDLVVNKSPVNSVETVEKLMIVHTVNTDSAYVTKILKNLKKELDIDIRS